MSILLLPLPFGCLLFLCPFGVPWLGLTATARTLQASVPALAREVGGMQTVGLAAPPNPRDFPRSPAFSAQPLSGLLQRGWPVQKRPALGSTCRVGGQRGNQRSMRSGHLTQGLPGGRCWGGRCGRQRMRREVWREAGVGSGGGEATPSALLLPPVRKPKAPGHATWPPTDL